MSPDTTLLLFDARKSAVSRHYTRQHSYLVWPFKSTPHSSVWLMQSLIWRPLKANNCLRCLCECYTIWEPFQRLLFQCFYYIFYADALPYRNHPNHVWNDWLFPNRVFQVICCRFLYCFHILICSAETNNCNVSVYWNCAALVPTHIR